MRLHTQNASRLTISAAASGMAFLLVKVRHIGNEKYLRHSLWLY